jgi:hypothetical protein
MTQEMDLKHIERKVWLSFHSDGIWDMFFGSLMLIMGIRILSGAPWVTFLLIVVILIGLLGKKIITVPRLGYVKFGRNRSNRFKRILIINLICCCVVAAIIIPALLGAPIPKEVRLISLSIATLIIFSGMAFIFDFKRMYIYAVLLAAGLTIFDLLGDIRGAILLTVAGLTIIIIGLAIFVLFLKKYPKVEQEESRGL